jgi:predicted amidophosphoribosyltransferase
MTLAARRAAGVLRGQGVPAGVAPCLYTATWARDSVGLSAEERRANLADRIRWRARAAPPAAAPVVIVDDVITSGTTVGCATAALARHGSPVTAAVTLAATAPWWARGPA